MQITAQAGVKRPLVQILVVVANIQIITLNTEVGKGSTLTSIGRGLGYPNIEEKSVSKWDVLLGPRISKGNWFNIPNLKCGY